MNKEKYLAGRKKLTDEAQAFIDAGKLEDANAKTKEIEALDAQYDNAAKAQANLNALAGKAPVAPVVNALVEGSQMSNEITEPTYTDMYDTAEYRMAFMKNCLSGTAIPAKFVNADANTKTSDVGAVIPTTIMNKIIEKIEATGMILPLITRTSYKGGLSIPTSSVKPTATWVAEGATSDKQKKSTGTIIFAMYKLRCAISVSLEVDTTAMPIFETTFINNVTEAMIKANEQAIINGTGIGQPKGILAETVVDGQNIDLTEGTAITYADLIKMEAALPSAYETGAKWFMTKKTFMAIAGMTDTAGQPIGRVNYGINGAADRTILGRQVVINDYMSSYATAVEADTVIVFLFNPKDYILNTNYQMTVKRYEDNDTEDIVTKAIMLVDGKVVDKNSLVTMTIKNS